ncbi:MAG: alkyl hydroperoxide reductase [Planctomycetota bacterium]
MRRLQARFEHELVVIGVHSAKFPAEKEGPSLRQAILRHGIEHPVVNDGDFEIWRHYAVRAWPTIVLVDPKGYYLGAVPGEIDADAVGEFLQRAIVASDARGELDRRPRRATASGDDALVRAREADHEPARTLSHPTRLAITTESTLFVADTGHHRILELDLAPDHRRARIARTFGSGETGLVDARGDRARFHAPHGIAHRGGKLYVADTENHALRAIELATGDVSTLAGTGEKAMHAIRPGRAATQTALRSPWGVWIQPPRVFIAMAGSHQVFTLEDEKRLLLFAGNGREALVDDSALDASFNQPSDVAGSADELFVADAEASAVRAIALAGKPLVSTLVGRGLFEWGDVDGVGDAASLQHPTGIAHADGMLFLADSYNHKVKRLDPRTRQVKTLLGNGTPGHADGLFNRAQLFEPQGVAVRGRHVFIADTNNHAIRVADLDTLRVHTLVIE